MQRETLCFLKGRTINGWEFKPGQLMPSWEREDPTVAYKYIRAGLAAPMDDPRVEALRIASGLPTDGPTDDEQIDQHGLWVRPLDAWWNGEIGDLVFRAQVAEPASKEREAFIAACRTIDSTIQLLRTPKANNLRDVFAQLIQAERSRHELQDELLGAVAKPQARRLLNAELDRQEAEIAKLRERIMATAREVEAATNE